MEKVINSYECLFIADVSKGEEATDATPRLDYMAQTEDKLTEVLAIEGAVNVATQVLKLRLRGIYNKVGGGVVHILHHAVRTLNYRLAVAPSDGRSHEAGNLTVERRGKRVRHANGVGLDKGGIVIPIV